MRKHLILSLVFSASMLALLATYGCSDDKAMAEQTLLEKKGNPTVQTSPVELRDFQSTIEASGTLVPESHARLTTLVGGKLQSIRADISECVRKGDILFEMRSVDYELALRQSQASLERAEVLVKDRRREMTRIENLFKGGSATEQARDQAITAFEDAASALKQAVAVRDTAEQALKDCTIRAPYDGVITAKYLQPGEYAKPGTEVFEIMDLSRLIAEVNVSERHAGKIGPGTSVIVLSSTGTEPVAGTITAINPKIDLADRTFLVKISIDNTQGDLQAGLFCTVKFILPPARNQHAIPAAALNKDRGKSTVWVIENGKAYQRDVGDNGIYDGWVWIRSGLEQDEAVVIEGAGALMNGLEVEVKNSAL